MEGPRHKAEAFLLVPGQFCPVSSPTKLPSWCTQRRRPPSRQGWPWPLGALPEAGRLCSCLCPQCYPRALGMQLMQSTGCCRVSRCCPPAPLQLLVHRQLLRPLLLLVQSLPLAGAGAKVDVQKVAVVVDTEQTQPSAWTCTVSHAEETIATLCLIRTGIFSIAVCEVMCKCPLPWAHAVKWLLYRGKALLWAHLYHIAIVQLVVARIISVCIVA